MDNIVIQIIETSHIVWLTGLNSDYTVPYDVTSCLDICYDEFSHSWYCEHHDVDTMGPYPINLDLLELKSIYEIRIKL